MSIAIIFFRFSLGITAGGGNLLREPSQLFYILLRLFLTLELQPFQRLGSQSLYFFKFKGIFLPVT